mmetsp:Transcript_32288/g.99543  ORF Transcript_32288/g.99543 Transcript_32288/m.99543 type:complete len:350 (+) Transcript_32288:416-1465(+)
MPENKRAIVKTHFAEASARAFRSPSTPSSAVSSRSSSSSGSPVSKMSRLLVLLLAATRSLAGSKHDRVNDGAKRQRARPITFLHITKVAGVSTTREFRARSYKNVSVPGEPCFADVYDPARRHVVLLRSPRAHVFSQYLECRFDNWGRKATKDSPDFPRGGRVTADFERWLDHFLDLERLGRRGVFNCLCPWNLQSRALTCTTAGQGRGAQLPQRPGNIADLRPSASAATAALDRVDALGLVDLYPETWCLIEAVTLERLPGQCDCNSTRSTALHHERHHVPAHDPRTLPASVLRKIDALTAVDRQLYARGARRFLDDVAATERRFERAFLCAERRAEFEADLAYVLRA